MWFGEELMTVQPRQRKAEHQDVDKKEGKVLRVFSSGRWLPQAYFVPFTASHGSAPTDEPKHEALLRNDVGFLRLTN